MSLETPTTQEINDNIIAQLQAAFNQVIPLLPKAFNRVLAKVLSGVFILLYKYEGFIFLQLFVQTASAKDTTVLGQVVNPLSSWGRLIGVTDRTAAVPAELEVSVNVEILGGVLPSGSQLLSALNGVTYITIGAVNLDAYIVPALIRAVSDQAGGNGAGALGNLEPGMVVSFANPLAEVSAGAVVDSQIVVGVDEESVSSYRQRIIDRFQKRPQGGAYADYKQWGEETTDIVNIYPYTSAFPGQVDVYVEANTDTDPDGIPTTPQLQAVLDNIELDENGLASRRPANALVNSFPITRTGFEVVVSGMVVDDEAQVEATIITALDEYFLGKEPWIVGLATPPRKDQITATGVAGVVEDIVSASSGVFGSVVTTISSAPISVYVLDIGEKSKADSVTFI